MPGARKACQPTATAHPGQSSPSGEVPGIKPASISHSPPCWGGSGGLAVGTAVGGTGLGGSVVAGKVAVSVGGKGVGESEGGGSVSVSRGVSAGAGGLGMTAVREGSGEGGVVALGWGVGAGTAVFVGRVSASRLFVGVGITTGARGPQPLRKSAIVNSIAARLSPFRYRLATQPDLSPFKQRPLMKQCPLSRILAIILQNRAGDKAGPPVLLQVLGCARISSCKQGSPGGTTCT